MRFRVLFFLLMVMFFCPSDGDGILMGYTAEWLVECYFLLATWCLFSNKEELLFIAGAGAQNLRMSNNLGRGSNLEWIFLFWVLLQIIMQPLL